MVAGLVHPSLDQRGGIGSICRYNDDDVALVRFVVWFGFVSKDVTCELRLLRCVFLCVKMFGCCSHTNGRLVENGMVFSFFLSSFLLTITGTGQM